MKIKKIKKWTKNKKRKQEEKKKLPRGTPRDGSNTFSEMLQEIVQQSS